MMLMLVYSAALTLGLAVAAPWWLWRMAVRGRYRAGLGERVGLVSERLRHFVAGRKIVWVHAVSVGEVLACERLVSELRVALGDRFRVVVSTTTETGQTVAQERFGRNAVFYWPLDFGFAVRAYLRVLKPHMVVLVESELWPRMLWECERAGVPVCVVNARVSDRSFRRAMRFKGVWGWMGRRVRVYLAQGEESAGRLRELGAGRVEVTGNLKFDLRPVRRNKVAAWVKEVAAGRKVIVAGSTLDGARADDLDEDQMLIQAWEGSLRSRGVLLVLAPRHPERFAVALAAASEFRTLLASNRGASNDCDLTEAKAAPEIVVLDTLGDLAAVYEVADVAFLGGSLVPRGGHNPLEAARFGVPVVMGPSYENFREVVDGLRWVDGVRIVERERLGAALLGLLTEDEGVGARGKAFYEAQTGATGRTVAALLAVMG